MGNFLKNRLFVIGALILLGSAAWTQSVVPDSVYRQLDTAISEKSPERVTALLASWSAAAWYVRVEDYTLKKARQLLVTNELDLAQAIALALIDNNLDNREAVGFYQSVQTAIVRRDADAKKAAEQQSVTEFRRQTEENKVREQINREYQTVVNNTTGTKVFLDQNFNAHYRTYSWNFNLGLANIDLLSGGEDLSAKYGLSVGGTIFRNGESFTVGMEADGDVMVLSLLGTPSVTWSGSAVGSFTSRSISKYLALRLGYIALGYDFGSEDLEEKMFLSPVAGLGFRDVVFGSSNRMQMSIDYYPQHLFEADLAAALSAQLLFSFVMADMQDFNFHFNVGLKDTAMLYTSGLQNDIKLSLSIGVGNNE